MTQDRLPQRLLVAVGSRRDRVCSIGSFARAEAQALEKVFSAVEVLEPDNSDVYPRCKEVVAPDVIFFHAPALHDRKRPWNALLSAVLLRKAFPKAIFIPVVHEFSEAPSHWKLRQALLIRMGHGAIVNSAADLKGVQKIHSRILRTKLGPTLYEPELLEEQSADERRRKLEAKITQARQTIAKKFELDESEKWILHPGLITPGKGVNFLGKIAPLIQTGQRLIVMGGQGPKERDRQFARETIEKLKLLLGEQLTVIDSPDDDTFKSMLTASDLVVLPYDAGVSERRSSFWSAMCCGANVWTTTGEFSGPLSIEKSGAHSVSCATWANNEHEALESSAKALEESQNVAAERRLKNLVWASKRSWNARAQDIKDFISSLTK